MNKQVMAMYLDPDGMPRAYAWGDISALKDIILCAGDMLNEYIKKPSRPEKHEFTLQLEIIKE